MFAELSVIWISLSIIVLCWVVVRMNQKIDEAVSNRKLFNNLDETAEPDEAPAGSVSRSSYPQGSDPRGV